MKNILFVVPILSIFMISGILFATISSNVLADSDKSENPGKANGCENSNQEKSSASEKNPHCVNQCDQNTALTWYLDVDGDGYGDDDTAIVTCNPPDGYVLQGGDCNDNEMSINPGAGNC